MWTLTQTPYIYMAFGYQIVFYLFSSVCCLYSNQRYIDIDTLKKNKMLNSESRQFLQMTYCGQVFKKYLKF
jgi:hypothetical protein